MKKVDIIYHTGFKLALMFFCFISAVSVTEAQSYEAYKLKAASKYWGAYNIYFEKFVNAGEAEFDVCADVFKEKFSGTYTGSRWVNSKIYNIVATKEEADIVISGIYKFSPKETMEVSQKLKTETGTKYPLKYTVNSYRQANRVHFTLDVKVTDKSGSQIDAYQLKDSILSADRSDVKLPKTKYTLDELKTKMIERTPSYMKGRYCIYSTDVWVKFLKLKVKDKALKEEYKLVNDYLNNKDFLSAGKIFKKIYEAGKDPMAAFNTAMCYEFVGDIGKAAEYYKIKFDFPSKKRMDTNKAIWEKLPQAYKASVKTF